ncbi:DUF2333 family protein [Atopomonas hussainii]|uniref:DUF2333 family protein n=1 Tax=Atopomonas hussainii TaxID=1429083 RepID=UPI0008FFEA5B
MQNWKDRGDELKARMGDTVDDVKSYFGGPLWSKVLAALVLIYLLAATLVGWYWSQEPDLFPVREQVQRDLEEHNQSLVTGYTTVSTLSRVATTLLDKPGGYLSNDKFPPGLWLDNMPSWEFGVLVQTRDLTRALRKDFSRSQTQSTEDRDLAQAEPRMNFDHRSWALPASETEYRDALKYLNRYAQRLSDPNKPDAQFYARADNLRNWLGDVETRLGSLSQRLSASVGRVRLNTDLAGDSAAKGATPKASAEVVKTPWLQLDDVFYEARGQAWALVHFLRAIEHDFADVLEKKNALVSVQQIIRELEATQDPLWSPIVLNGEGFGVLANHSLVMANYISRANAAIIDLRQLLEQG